MRFTGLIVLMIFDIVFLYAQKPVIELQDLEKWPTVDYANISNNGRYVMYTIRRPKGPQTLIIQSTDSYDQQELIGASLGEFTRDSRFAVFQLAGDSLCLMRLNDMDRTYIPDVVSFELLKEYNAKWIAYKTKVGD